MRKTQCFFKEPAICLALPYNNTEINIISLVLQTRQLIKGVTQPFLSHKTLISCLIYKIRLIIFISVLLYGKARQRGLNPPPLNHTWLLGQRSVKNSPANAGVVGRCVISLDWEDPLEQEIATHSSILAWKTPMDRGAWWVTYMCNMVHPSQRIRHY